MISLTEIRERLNVSSRWRYQEDIRALLAECERLATMYLQMRDVDEHAAHQMSKEIDSYKQECEALREAIEKGNDWDTQVYCKEADDIKAKREKK